MDQFVAFDTPLADDAADLDDNCFQCIVAGGKYTNPTSLLSGKCNRGTNAENLAAPVKDPTLKSSTFMTAVKSCPSSGICSDL